MAAETLAMWIIATGLLSLRIAPMFAFAPPFTLTRTPPLFRVLVGMTLAACLVTSNPAATSVDLSAGALVAAAFRELLLGSVFVLAFQLSFAALYTVGRTIDIQAGYGLAVIIDPTTQSQTPLVGTIFGLLAGAVFFAMDGPAELLRLLAASLDAMPLGAGRIPTSLAPLGQYLGTVFLAALGIGGGLVLSLFLTDMAIAALARTVPQMNVLVIGFQLKVLVLMLVLPVVIGISGALLMRLMRLTLDGIPSLL